MQVGILSFAHYHANFWAEAFHDDPRVNLVGVWDDNEARGKAAASRFRTQFFPGLDDLLQATGAVAICSETACHMTLIEQAAARACAILCEKPIATKLSDADAIARAVSRGGAPFMQSFPKRLDPASLRLKMIVDSGKLGRVRLVRLRHGHDHGCDPDFLSGWWSQPEKSGGGTLIDEGVHAFDFLRWMFGDPDAVQASIASTSNATVEDTAVAILRWPDGLLGEVSTSWTFRAAEQSVEIYGTEGTALLSGVDLASRDYSGPAYLKIATAGSRKWELVDVVPAFVQGRFHHVVATTFVDCFTQSRPCPTGIAEGRAALAIVLAAYDSARNRQEILLADYFAQH